MLFPVCRAEQPGAVQTNTAGSSIRRASLSYLASPAPLHPHHFPASEAFLGSLLSVFTGPIDSFLRVFVPANASTMCFEQLWDTHRCKDQSIHKS